MRDDILVEMLSELKSVKGNLTTQHYKIKFVVSNQLHFSYLTKWGHNMKYLFRLIVVIQFFLLSLSAQNYGLGNTDPSVFSKYQIPETKLRLLSLFSDFYFGSENMENIYLFFPATTQKEYNSSLSFSFNPYYNFLNEDDESKFSFIASLAGNINNDVQEKNDVIVREVDRYAINLRLSSNYYNYFSNNNSFYSLNSEINFQMIDSREDNKDLDREKYYEGQKLQNYRFGIGLGWGKIRDVTSVVSAIRLQERMKHLNILNSDLSEATIYNLAEHFSKYLYYNQVHERYDKYFWGDLESILSKDGISLEGINQYAGSYLREVQGELRFLRKEGFETGININFDYSNNYNSEWDVTHKIHEQFEILANVYAAFSHQLNLYSQVSASLSLSGGPSVIENSSVKQRYTISAKGGYGYELTDRLVLSVLNELLIEFENMNKQRKYLNNDLNLSLNYFMEDNLAMNLSYVWRYWETKIPEYQEYSSGNNIIRLGLSYYFDRGFIR